MSNTNPGLGRFTALALLAVGMLTAGAPRAMADDKTVCMITARNDAVLTVATDDDKELLVVLQDNTEIKRGTNHANSSELIPGLRIKVKGSFDGQQRLIADDISFSSQDYRTAMQIQAGTERMLALHGAAIQKNGQGVAQNKSAIQSLGGKVADNSKQIEANDLKATATSGVLASRINDLDDYNVVDSVTLHFANGSAKVNDEAMGQLRDFIEKNKGVEAYKVQVQGYASAVGPTPLNNTLSVERATNVTMALQQNGIPSTSLLLPAGMGTTEQVADNSTKAGQAENRRVVISVLQNKGIPAK